MSTFEALYRAHFGFVHAVVESCGVASRDAPDVTQHVFGLVYRKIETYNQKKPAEGWLYCLARRAAKDHRARFWRELIPDCLPDTTAMLSPEDILIAAEDTHLRKQRHEFALQKLKAIHREVLALYYENGLTAPEIAAFLYISVNTVYNRLRGGRAHYFGYVRLWDHLNQKRSIPCYTQPRKPLT